MALAGKFGYNVCILNLSKHGFSDDQLAVALSHVPPNSIVLLEDVDAAFPTRDPSSARFASHEITFSGLLNTLDGATSRYLSRL